MTVNKNTALVVGGNGIISRNMVSYLEGTGNWEVIVTSQSPLGYETEASYVALDLTRADSIQAERERFQRVTHVFFAAYVERKTLSEQTADNLQLLVNLVRGIERVAPGFRHLTFIQGG